MRCAHFLFPTLSPPQDIVVSPITASSEQKTFPKKSHPIPNFLTFEINKNYLTMASTSETGHAKNVANFDKLLSSLNG